MNVSTLLKYPWHSVPLPVIAESTVAAEFSTGVAERANELLSKFQKDHTKQIDSFTSQILKAGTTSDKTSAIALMFSDNPLAGISFMDSLTVMAQKKKREESIRAVRVMVDWFISPGGLPENRKLVFLKDRPLSNSEVSDAHLIVWAFEDYLKRAFFSLLSIIESLSMDPLPQFRTQAITFLYTLISKRMEREANILTLIVNKLGDQSGSVASKCSYLITKLLSEHPGMKPIVINEAAEFAQKQYRTQGAKTAVYFTMITLNQIPLTIKESGTAAKLVKVYFDGFTHALSSLSVLEKDKKKGKQSKKAMEKKRKRTDGREDNSQAKKDEQEHKEMMDDAQSKFLNPLLTGLNRAIPFSDIETEQFEKYVDVLFRVTHTGSFNISIQALSLIWSVGTKTSTISARYYRALYAALMDPRLASSSKHTLFLNLLFKSLKADANSSRVCAFVKRLLQLFSATKGLRRLLTDPEDDDGHSYDGIKRDPEYCNASSTCLWEITPYFSHFHPTVQLMSSQFASNAEITSTGDLNLHSLIHFLDKFVYRNPKKSQKSKGSSLMQPAVSIDHVGMVANLQRGTGKNINAKSFWDLAADKVQADEMFFHKFFNLRKSNGKKSKADTKDSQSVSENDDDDDSSPGSEIEDNADEGHAWNGFNGTNEDDADGSGVHARLKPQQAAESDSDSDNDDEDEEDIWRLMKATMPKKGEDEHLLELSDDSEDGNSDDDAALAAAMVEDSEDGSDDSESVASEGMVSDDELNEAVFLDSDDDLPSKAKGKVNVKEQVSDDSDAPESKRSKKKRKTVRTPLFASADDYAHLLDQEDDQDN